ncbi:MAG: DUF3782 domain-containing protein [Candidatus Methanomethylicia archaeon]|nr:DUF3782 domain-containing protein [Candidatus Methanomethylicia archaeon]
MVEILSKEEKLKILKTLEEDLEFRYAIAGLIGISEILRRLNKLEENQGKLWENQNKLWEEIKGLRENQNKIWEEIKNLREGQNKLWEEIKGLRNGHDKLWKEVSALKVIIGSIGRRWGLDLEKAILEIYRHVLEERGIEPGKVEKFVYIDVDGRYYRKGAKVELDVYIHNEKIYFIEIKSHGELEDVEWFKEKTDIVEKIIRRKSEKLIFIAVNIDKEAVERAKQLEMDVIYGAIIE